MDTNITSITDAQRKREWSVNRPPRDVYQPAPARQEAQCPTCHFPLADSSYGWVKLYAPHADHSRCEKRSGFCMIPCPMCSGGVEAKRQAQLVNDLFGDAHIPWYAKEWSFNTVPVETDPVAVREIRTFTAECLSGHEQKRGLYLVGDKGNGKTGLALSALQYILRKGHSGVFITTIELFDILRAAIGASQRLDSDLRRIAGRDDAQTTLDKFESSQGAKLLRLVKEVEWLVLDDLGVECGTKYVIQQLYLIVEARRSHGLYTIFTSNRDAKDLERYWRSESDGVFQDGARVIDRLGEYTLVIPVSAKGNLREKRR